MKKSWLLKQNRLWRQIKNKCFLPLTKSSRKLPLCWYFTYYLVFSWNSIYIHLKESINVFKMRILICFGVFFDSLHPKLLKTSSFSSNRNILIRNFKNDWLDKWEKLWYNKTIQKRSIYGYFRNSSKNWRQSWKISFF